MLEFWHMQFRFAIKACIFFGFSGYFFVDVIMSYIFIQTLTDAILHRNHIVKRKIRFEKVSQKFTP